MTNQTQKNGYQWEKVYRNGYQWKKVYRDMSFGEYSSTDGFTEWALVSPDGREVTYRQAIEEIERGLDVVLEEIEAEKKAQKEELLKENEERQHNFDEMDKFDQKVTKLTNGLFQVECSLKITWELIYKTDIINSAYRANDTVEKAYIDNVPIYRITKGTSLNDYGYVTYWTSDPQRVGLKPVATGGDADNGIDYSRFADMF